MKFGIGQDWVPMKYDISIDMPEILDLSVLKGFGLQPGEELLPETPAPVKGKFSTISSFRNVETDISLNTGHTVYLVTVCMFVHQCHLKDHML